jgi:hypothetical protein
MIPFMGFLKYLDGIVLVIRYNVFIIDIKGKDINYE